MYVYEKSFRIDKTRFYDKNSINKTVCYVPTNSFYDTVLENYGNSELMMNII